MDPNTVMLDVDTGPVAGPAGNSTTGDTRMGEVRSDGSWNDYESESGESSSFDSSDGDPAEDEESPDGEPKPDPVMLRTLQTRTADPQVIAAEMAGVYASFLHLEDECTKGDNRVGNHPGGSFRHHEYNTMVRLHLYLIHESNDYLSGSFYPGASPELRALAVSRRIPERVWSSGIQAFVEMLRAKLPRSREHIIYFLSESYTMISLMYETLPFFRDKWAEMLGDISHYRWKLEDVGPWPRVAASWYNRAIFGHPDVGKLHLRLSLVTRGERPDAYTERLFHLCKAGCAARLPHVASVNAINDMFREPAAATRPFLMLLRSIIQRTGTETFDTQAEECSIGLALQMHASGQSWRREGTLLAIILAGAQAEYGNPQGEIMQALQREDRPPRPGSPDGSSSSGSSDSGDDGVDTPMTDVSDPVLTNNPFALANALATRLDQVVFARHDDDHILGYVHARLVFYTFLMERASTRALTEEHIPWKHLAALLNALLARVPRTWDERIQREISPCQHDTVERVLPEDNSMRGLFWSAGYFPGCWFPDVYDEESLWEAEQDTDNVRTYRMVRILRLGWRLARYHRWIAFYPEHRAFRTCGEYDKFCASLIRAPYTVLTWLFPHSGSGATARAERWYVKTLERLRGLGYKRDTIVPLGGRRQVDLEAEMRKGTDPDDLIPVALPSQMGALVERGAKVSRVVRGVGLEHLIDGGVNIHRLMAQGGLAIDDIANKFDIQTLVDAGRLNLRVVRGMGMNPDPYLGPAQ